MTRSTRSLSLLPFSPASLFSGAESSSSSPAAGSGDSALTGRSTWSTYQPLSSCHPSRITYLALFIRRATRRGIRDFDVGSFLELDILSARATPVGEGHFQQYQISSINTQYPVASIVCVFSPECLWCKKHWGNGYTNSPRGTLTCPPNKTKPIFLLWRSRQSARGECAQPGAGMTGSLPLGEVVVSSGCG